MDASQYSELQQLLQQYVNTHEGKLDIGVVKRCLQSVESHQVYQLGKSVRSSGHSTVIYAAVGRGHSEVIICILELFTEKDRYELLTIQDLCQRTPLHFSARLGNTEIATCIMNSISTEKRCELMKVVDVWQLTPIHLAICARHAEVIRCMVSLSTMSSEDLYKLLTLNVIFGDTPIHYIACWGMTEALKYLLDYLTPHNKTELFNTVHRSGCTPLDVAANCNQTNIELILIKKET